jgi:purine catabolism regulator
VAVSEAVHARIVDAQLAELRASEELHQTFTELSVEGAAPAEVVRQAARIAGRPVILENLAHQVLAYDSAGADASVLLEGWEARSRGIAVNGRTGESAGWLATMVGARGHDWGRLLLACGPHATGRDVMLVERGAATLALSRLVERDRETLERQTHRTLLAGLLTHSLPAAETAMRAKALGVPLEGRTLVAVVSRMTSRGGEAALETQARLRDFAETSAAAVRDARLVALVGSIDDVSVGILIAATSRENVPRALEGLASALAKRVRGNRSDIGPSGTRVVDYVMAAGSPVASVRDARRSFLEAAQVADAAQHQPALPYYQLADVRLRGLLHLLRDDERLQTYVERELGPLLAYDDKHANKLIPILTAYLLQGRNKSAAADSVHLSRPSFYDRLHRIESILDVDLDDVESCLSMHVALMALEALRRTSPSPAGPILR